MRNALAQQIRIQHGLKEKPDPGSVENPFARSESLMALYQREKAKQLYYEQLAIVRQRRDYAHKVADLEKRHSLAKLELSRKEYFCLIRLEKDFSTIKKGKVEARHSLESYWSDQISTKNRLKKELEFVIN